MARIFSDNFQFKKILPSSFREGEFEEIISLQAPSLYPDYYVIPFKKTVSSPHGNAKADLIFIAKDYKDWYVVEVEMTYHNFDSHIELQTRRLSSAYYDDDVVSYICKKCPSLDKTYTARLIHYEPVRVLLIMNEFREDWADELKNKYGAIISVFHVFHNHDFGSRISVPDKTFLVDRNYPIYSLSSVTKCSVHPYYPYLGLEDNSILNLQPGEEVVLEYDDCVTFWKATVAPGKPIWLKVSGRDEFIDKRKNYQITKLRDNSLLLNVI